MGAVLGENSYGKSRVRLVKVTRRPDRHELKDLTVDVAFEGDYQAVHDQGDNAPVLPTDTMKNAVYGLARQHSLEPVEDFGAVLVRHFLAATAHARRVRVTIAEHPWERMEVDGRPHHHSFIGGASEKRLAYLSGDREAIRVEGGIEDLVVLKTTGSGFEGFARDRYTTLRETADRIFATSIRARWSYGRGEGVDYDACFGTVRAALLESFAGHDESRSVQHTLYVMGSAALERCPKVDEIRLALPNRHHLLVDLSPFGLDNPNQVFVATTEPYGLIEATLRRE